MVDNMKVYVIDIDGVICTEDVDVPDRLPYKSRIDMLNQLYDDGNVITYFTARGMNSQDNNQLLADEKYRELTTHQLDKWGCKYDRLFFGKPNADVYIDNKNGDMHEFFGE